jgi:hypothetical protein
MEIFACQWMPMKNRYRLFQGNNGIFFIQDNLTPKQESNRQGLSHALPAKSSFQA